MNNKEDFKRNSINVHQRLGTSIEVSSEQMDNERLNTRTYDYLCRLEEAKAWVSEICKVPESYEEFEEEMRKGIFLAKIAKFYNNESVPYIFTDKTLQYRHTDNINFFLNTLLILKLPRHYFFEVIDLYEKKNFPKVVYCLHALAQLLKNKGLSVGIKKADGQVFKQSDIERIDNELANINLPNFLNINCEENERSLLEEQTRNELLNLSESFNTEKQDIVSDSVFFQNDEPNKVNCDDEDGELIIEPLNRNNYNDIDAKLKLTIHSFLMKKSFNDIYFKKSVSIFSLRRFLFIFFKKSNEMIKEQQIDHLHKMINNKLKEIYNKEIYLEGIENRIKLMIDNKLDLYKIKKKITNDYKFLSDIFSQVIHNKKYIIGLLYENLDLNIILKLFNYCSTIKEEYLFINLILELPIDLSYNLMITYFRSSKESENLSKGIYKIIKNLSNLDITCDPTEIYKELFETEIGSIDKALENSKVQEIFQKRLSTLRGVVKSFIDLIQSTNLPYILKYYLSVNKIECIQFYKDFIFPLFIYNETKNCFSNKKENLNEDLTSERITSNRNEGAFEIDSIKKKKTFRVNESHIIDSSIRNKVLILIDVLISIINEEDLVSYYSPISEEFTAYKKSILSKYVIENLSLDLYFQKESINELVRVQKSIIYLTVREINNVLLILNKLNLYDVELVVEDDDLNISLSILNTDWITEQDEEDVGLDNFIKQVKKKLIYVLAVCRGTNVMDVLLKESTKEEQDAFKKVMSNEEKFIDSNNKEKKFNINEKLKNTNIGENEEAIIENCLLDGKKINEVNDLDKIKEQLIDDLKIIEKKGIVSYDNLYGEILSLIANDIIVLRFMSLERNKELKVNELTYSNLLSKEEYLDLKIKEYDEYLIQYSLSQLNRKKRNTDNMIEKLKMSSTYGSYYFKSNELVDLGVLNQVYNIPDSRDLCFVLASNEPLKFQLYIYIDNCTITDPWTFRLEDLLMRKNEVIDVLRVCSFKVDNFIKVINERYLGY